LSAKNYEELNAEIVAIQEQMVAAKKNERGYAPKELKRLCKEFDFTAEMLKRKLGCQVQS
jgi:hypothetical protein